MRWLVVTLAIAAVGAAISLVGQSTASVPRAPRVGARSASGSAEVVQAQLLPGDQLLAGPVLLDDRFAVWAEAGRHRLLLRSLDLSGRTRTIFSTRQARGVPESAQWPFDVATLAAGAGRLAFVEHVMPCWSSPPRNPRCAAYPAPPEPWDSTTLFAGRPGKIRALASIGRCGARLEPAQAAVSSAGVAVVEERDICPGRADARIVLRSFSGGLIRVLTPRSTHCVDCIATLRAAGPWVAFVREATNYGHPDRLTVVRARTGATAAKVSRTTIGDVEVDPSGDFALLTTGPQQRCQVHRGPDLGRLMVGAVGHDGLRTLSGPVDWNLSASTPGSAIANGQVAFFRPEGSCQRATEVMIASGGVATPVPGVGPARAVNGVAPAPLAFDGHLLATRHGDTIQLTATGCPHPTVPVPPGEPVYSSGLTELVSGLYIQGGAIPPPPCKPEPRGPYAGTIKVMNAQTGKLVARQAVKDGQLAHIRLPAGSYEVTAHFSGGITTQPVKVRVRAQKTVRQDMFEDVP
jgi:hypothetical protein